MLGQYRHDDHLELTALGLMDGDRIGEIKLQDIIFLIWHLPAIREKGHHTAETDIIDGQDRADIAVENPQIIVVAPMDHPVADPKNPLADQQLRFARLPGGLAASWITLLRLAVPSLPRVIGERIWISHSPPMVFGNPLPIEAHHRINRG